MEITITAIVNEHKHENHNYGETSYTVRVSKFLNKFNDGAFPLRNTVSAQCLVRQENVKE